METRAFAPLYTRSTSSTNGTLLPSVTVAASVTAASSTQIGGTTTQIEVCNTTSAWAYLNFGVFGAVTAATVATGYPVAPGSDKVFSVDPEVSGASVILAAGGVAGNVIFTRGEGV